MTFKEAPGYRAACVMAAIDLERGLEHGGRGWGSQRSDLVDNFDSEMQEWEDQLQDIQRKIEEVNPPGSGPTNKPFGSAHTGKESKSKSQEETHSV